VEYDTSCWIGLKSAHGPGLWGWDEETTMLDTTYRSWEWREPNQMKHIDGLVDSRPHLIRNKAPNPNLGG
jgi:hypothetical protein